MIANDWLDYEVIATGDGEKLERWGKIILLRPDPQVIWKAQFCLKDYKGLNAHYIRECSGGGRWNTLTKMPEEWIIKWKNLSFCIKPMGFKHTGLFPEQAVNWQQITDILSKAHRRANVLNLFAYTGGATVACAASNAFVTHVDAAKGMVERAKANCDINSLPTDSVRYIIDDCKKFVMREIKRGKKYDGIIMDPPSYGRGPNGEMWKLEDSIFDLVKLTTELLVDDPLFFLINSYTTGLQPSVIDNILSINLNGYKGVHSGYEVCLPTSEDGIVLPCGCSGLWKS